MNPNDQSTTWAALLGRWTEFAQSSLALPRDAEGDRWRAAAAPIIGLQAVTFALGDLDRLGTGAERALATDRAEILIRKHAAALHDLWRSEPLHPELMSLIDDARAALAAVRDGGYEWRITAERLIADHPAQLLDLLVEAGFSGDLFLPSPGVPLFRTSPAAFMRAGAADSGETAEALRHAVTEFLGDVGEPERIPGPRQVYRQFDFGLGRAVRDVVVRMDDTLPPGQPLLVPAMQEGRPQPVSLPPRRPDERLDALPVLFGEAPAGGPGA